MLHISFLNHHNHSPQGFSRTSLISSIQTHGKKAGSVSASLVQIAVAVAERILRKTQSKKSQAPKISFEGKKMTSFYDEIEIEDMTFDEETQTYYYDCPCGDKFEITVEELANGDEIAHCPSCSLILR